MVQGMFGDLRALKEQAAFEAHPYGWLFTADTVYRIAFFTLSVLSGYDAVYNVPCSAEDFAARLAAGTVQSRPLTLSPEDRLIAFSTCASDFADARALWAGKLVPTSDYLQ